MNNFESNNSNSATSSVIPGSNWQWLTDRLPTDGLSRLNDWLSTELIDLETSQQHMVSPRSQKRDLRQEFASTRRSSEI